ncbi:lysosomal acid glucosylceramidase-like [Plodia interpunctella]|uniref:lysosomal acid glucosylceramidase-like n=1 Tax=Plodia interpunctella TaxID=58824 RepID=UPI002368B3E0|nr:lysosomal acid glucosylceramidase-like [Plodia interpunctella]XP_053599526.1 lysosomal acid glucosylceramidase-like [Plodia interpunctella]
MERVGVLNIILSFTFLLATQGLSEDLPCAARDVGIEGRSIVCVCNATYCDTIYREAVPPGTYFMYTSSNAGKRFEKSSGVIEVAEESFDDDETGADIISDFKNFPAYDDEDDDFQETIWNRVVLRLFTIIRSQFLEGFGGSVTDAAAINWRKLSDPTQREFIRSYFSTDGLEYNLIRVPIGGADFSTHPYTYNELPWNDGALSNFSLSDEDFFFKLPMIKLAQEAAPEEIKITASTWSPPIWMKTNERITGFGQVKPEFYQSYADYHIRFIEEYEKAEVKIWAITTTNEPINGIVPIVNFNSLGWTPAQLGRWVANNLGPTVRNSKFNQTLILAVDDQRYIIPIWLRGMESADPRSIEYIDGIAIHYYGNFVPPDILSRIHHRYPGKILLSTEACEGPMPWDLLKVEVGSWARARRYTRNILEDLNNYVVGWIDWNLCLDPEGGPNWAENFVDAPILVYEENDEFIKQPMFYAMGHFSKFIPRGSRVIRAARRSLATLENIAVLTPRDTIVMVIQNRYTSERSVRINIDNTRFIRFRMEPESIKTIEINPNS